MNNSSNGLRIFTKLIISAVIIGLTAAVVIAAVKLKPKAKKKKISKMIPVVEVISLKKSGQQAIIESMGEVSASKIMILKSRVKGEVIALHTDFTVGTTLKKGEFIAQIDKTDYEINIMSRKADLTKAQVELKLEQGRQQIAKHEWEMLKEYEGSVEESSLALREPQLKAVVANIESAKVALKRAEVDLKRTKITVPFDATIISTNVREGDQADAQTILATLIGTQTYWAELSIAIHKLKWINVPGLNGTLGSEVELTSNDGLKSTGRVIKLLPNLQEQGRMARVLVEIANPTQLSPSRKRPLLVGEFVRTRIMGIQMGDVTKIPNSAFKNNREVWLITKDKKLEVKVINPLWEDANFIYTDTTVAPSKKLIVNGLSLAIEGMTLKEVGSK